MSKITNDGLTRYGAGCFIAVLMSQRINRIRRMVVFSLLKSISGSSTLALKFTVLVAQNQKCVAGLAWPKAVSGVPVSLYPPRSKVQLYHIYIQPVLLYGSETWALTRALQDKVDAFDNMCLRRILRIPYTDHVTNATVRLQAGSPP